MLYDIKTVEFGQQHQKPKNEETTNTTSGTDKPTARRTKLEDSPTKAYFAPTTPLASLYAANLSYSSSADTATSSSSSSSCSVITQKHAEASTLELSNPAQRTHMTLLSLRRRRVLQRQACLLSILAAFVFGLALGVFMPMFGFANVFASLSATTSHGLPVASTLPLLPLNRSRTLLRPPSDFPTIYATREGAPTASAEENPFSVAFIQEQQVELSAEEVFRNAFHLEQLKDTPDSMLVKKLDAADGSIKEFTVQRTSSGRFLKGAERRISKPTLTEQMLVVNPSSSDGKTPSIKFVPVAQRIVDNARNQRDQGIIKRDIYWGDLVERNLPKGFTAQDSKQWLNYVATQGVVTHLEPGCGRMQNRLVIFADGMRACARYRQNTDQIQGELFSFYLGQLLNMTNLAPSAAAVIDLEASTWSSAVGDITQAQWKQQRPVVLTQWLPDLEPAGIPQPFQPLERHLNKYDVWNITLGAHQSPTDETPADPRKGLLKRLEAANLAAQAHQSTPPADSLSPPVQVTDPTAVMPRLIELAQWSDLIVFDYLIANLDRVVNNLYNFQWNADIMAAPAHNLARQINTQLLVFLDNESGLLHGYRLLKKYEAYHGLLLDNLCVFREPTIEALRQLRAYGAGRRLRELFAQTTSAQVRDVLPSLPDKSIKILVDRIDRVLGQVQKCRDLLADR